MQDKLYTGKQVIYLLSKFCPQNCITDGNTSRVSHIVRNGLVTCTARTRHGDARYSFNEILAIMILFEMNYFGFTFKSLAIQSRAICGGYYCKSINLKSDHVSIMIDVGHAKKRLTRIIEDGRLD